MKQAETAIDCVYHLLQAYANLDVEGVLYYLTDEITWIGTSAHEHKFGKSAVRELLQDDFLNDPVPYQVEITQTNVIPLREDIYNIFLIAYFSKPSVNDLKISTRCSFMCVQTDEAYQIASWHGSVAFGEQMEGEYFPIVFANDILQKATYDALTGLMNRVSFEDLVKRQIDDHRQPFAYILIDLDNFKYVNDHYGHKNGDEVLVFVARQLQAVFGQSDAIGRLGGDEFVVLVPSATDETIVVEKVNQFINSISTPLYLDGHTYIPSASVGVFFCREGYQADYVHCYKAADAAMYNAKNSGKSTWSIKK